MFSVKKGLMRVCLEVRAINYCVFCAFVSRWFFSSLFSRVRSVLSVSTPDVFKVVFIIYIIVFVSRVKDGNFGLLRNRLKFINFQILRIISSTSSGA